MSGQIYQLTVEGAPPEDWAAEDLDALHDFMDGRVQFDTPADRPRRGPEQARIGQECLDSGLPVRKPAGKRQP